MNVVASGVGEDRPTLFGVRAVEADDDRVATHVETVEEAERLRDPTHVRSYSEDEWRGFLASAGLTVGEVRLIDKTHPFDAWLARTGCKGDEAARVRRLLSARTSADGASWTDTKILLRGRKP